MTSKDQKKLERKWENTLKKYGLGVAQPMTDHSDGELADAPAARTKKKENISTDYVTLRKWMDAADVFMVAHQITKIRTIEREIPEWALSNKEVQRILLTSFPKLGSDKRQKARAEQWASAIYLYYRMKLPRQVVAKEMKISEFNLNRLIQRIGYVSRGLNARGEKRIRKIVLPLPQPLREVGEERGNERI